MELERYVADLRGQLAAVADTGDAEARAVAERLSVTLDAAVRVVLLEALSDAAAEITREVAPASVDIRLRGRDPMFVVSQGAAPAFAEPAAPPPAEADGTDGDDTVTSRTTLRLPDRLKARVEQAATEDGISVNAWLVRAIAAALEPKQRRAVQRSGDSFIGWVR